MALDQHQALLADYVEAIGGSSPVFDDDGFVDFELSGQRATVNVKEGGSRLRGRVVVAQIPDVDVAHAWLDSQVLPPTSELAIWGTPAEGAVLRLVWERSTDATHDAADPIRDELAHIQTAWATGADLHFPELAQAMPDPRDEAPQQAWLMLGDEASFPTDDALGEAWQSGESGVFEVLWTAAKQTQPGDLLLFYFTGQRKAVHFVARAASSAFYTADLAVDALGTVRDQQWWVYCTPLMPIEPIPLQVIRDATDGELLLRGRSGKFLKPATVAALPFVSTDPDLQGYVDEVVTTPTGRADLPSAESMTLDDVVSLAGGAMRLEADVEEYVVEPLLRAVLADTELAWTRQFPIGRKRADYVVTRSEVPQCVIEVKLAINDAGSWQRSPDLAQVTDYASTLDVPAVLMDTQRLVLIDRGAVVPSRIIERVDLASREVASALRQHLGID